MGGWIGNGGGAVLAPKPCARPAEDGDDLLPNIQLFGTRGIISMVVFISTVVAPVHRSAAVTVYQPPYMRNKVWPPLCCGVAAKTILTICQ
jgi:hypothetical protein